MARGCRQTCGHVARIAAAPKRRGGRVTAVAKAMEGARSSAVRQPRSQIAIACPCRCWTTATFQGAVSTVNAALEVPHGQR